MELKPGEIIKQPMQSVRKIGRQAVELFRQSTDSHYLAEQIIEEKEKKQLTDAEMFLRVAEKMDMRSTALEQQRTIVYLLTKSILREVNSENSISAKRLYRLNRVIEDMPEGENFELIGLSDEETAIIRDYISNF